MHELAKEEGQQAAKLLNLKLVELEVNMTMVTRTMSSSLSVARLAHQALLILVGYTREIKVDTKLPETNLATNA